MSERAALAITASCGPCSCAARTAAGEIRRGDDSDAAGLPAAVRALFAAIGCAPADLDELRVDLGPGSYTGLRVALTFARTLHSLTGARMLATTSLQLAALVAWTEDGIERGRTLRPVLDARRGRLHHAPVRFAGVELAAPPRATTPAELQAAIAAGEVLIAAPELHAQLEPIARACGAELRASGTYDGRHLFHGALRLRETEPAGLEPLYLMGSYAETPEIRDPRA
jgi:tRNA threonylcarbamoyladenosine biosynthesis protein TsaB